MKAQLECIYKGIQEVKGGSFLNTEGQKIEYKTFYKLRFDQIINGLPKETDIRINNELALNTARNFSLYDKVVITFNIVIYSKSKVNIKITDIKKI